MSPPRTPWLLFGSEERLGPFPVNCLFNLTIRGFAPKVHGVIPYPPVPQRSRQEDLGEVGEVVAPAARKNDAVRHRPVSPQSPSDACLVQIVGGHFHFYAITDGEPDPAFAHFPTDGGQHDVIIVEFNPEHRPR